MKDYFTVELQEKKTGKIILFKMSAAGVMEAFIDLRAKLPKKLYKIVLIDYSMN